MGGRTAPLASRTRSRHPPRRQSHSPPTLPARPCSAAVGWGALTRIRILAFTAYRGAKQPDGQPRTSLKASKKSLSYLITSSYPFSLVPSDGFGRLPPAKDVNRPPPPGRNDPAPPGRSETPSIHAPATGVSDANAAHCHTRCRLAKRAAISAATRQ